MNKEVVIKLDGVYKKFKKTLPLLRTFLPRKESDYTVALNGLSLQIKQGEAVAIMGKNGAGKSTLLRILVGIVEPDSGKVSVFGANPVQEPIKVRSNLGFVLPNERSFFWRISVSENLKFFATLQGLSGKKLQEETEYLLHKVGLSDVASKPYKDLSDGMRQRLAVARGLIDDPPLLLVDEGTLHIDEGSLANFYEMFRFSRNGKPRTLVMITHRLEEALAVCNRIVVMDNGKVKADLPANSSRTEIELALGAQKTFKDGK